MPPAPSECESRLQAVHFRLLLGFLQSERLTAGCSLVLEGGVVPATIAAWLQALPTVGSLGGQLALEITGGGVAVRLEGLRIEGSGGGNAIICGGGASLAAERCEVAGEGAYFGGAGTTGALRECVIVGSEGQGLHVRCGASVSVEGGAVRGCADEGVYVDDSGSRVTVRCRPPLPFVFPALPARPPPPRFFGPLVSEGSFLWLILAIAIDFGSFFL